MRKGEGSIFFIFFFRKKAMGNSSEWCKALCWATPVGLDGKRRNGKCGRGVAWEEELWPHSPSYQSVSDILMEQSVFCPGCAQLRWLCPACSSVSLVLICRVPQSGRRGGCQLQPLTSSFVLIWGCSVCWSLSCAAGFLSPAFVWLAHVPSNFLQVQINRTKNKLAVSAWQAWAAQSPCSLPGELL